MNTPYFNTNLYSTVSLHPSQMDNDIYKHLKNNLIRKLQGKCYKSYGYISKIYKIEERNGGIIIAEDSSASATYHVKFSCKLCKPLKNTTIICEVIAINKSLIYLRNGPIHVLIFEGKDHINQNNFVYDEKRNVLLAKIEKDKGIPVVTGTFVKIRVINTRIENGATRIIVFGTLESIASKKESDESITTRESDDIESIEYDKYIKLEDNNQEMTEFHQEDEITEEEDEEQPKKKK